LILHCCHFHITAAKKAEAAKAAEAKKAENAAKKAEAGEFEKY